MLPMCAPPYDLPYPHYTSFLVPSLTVRLLNVCLLNRHSPFIYSRFSCFCGIAWRTGLLGSSLPGLGDGLSTSEVRIVIVSE